MCRLSSICHQLVRERGRIRGYRELQGVTSKGQKGSLTSTNENYTTSGDTAPSRVQVPPATPLLGAAVGGHPLARPLARAPPTSPLPRPSPASADDPPKVAPRVRLFSRRKHGAS